MKNMFESKHQEENVLSKVRQEINVISNIPCIFEKIENEGFYKPIYKALESLINNELSFALSHLIPDALSPDRSELKRQLVSNSYIFKENLKIICSLVSELISGVHLEGKNNAPKSR